MKNVIVTIITAIFTLMAFSALAQVQCQTLSNGQVICTPAGGGSSIYR